MENENKTKSLSPAQLIQKLERTLARTRTPFLRAILENEMRRLHGLDFLFLELNEEIQDANNTCNNLELQIQKHNLIFQIYGLSENEVDSYNYFYTIEELEKLRDLTLKTSDFIIPLAISNRKLCSHD